MVVKYDPLHMDAETHVAPTAPAWSRTLLQRTPAAHVSENSGVFGRAVSAASSVVISHDTDGNRKLNTPGLFRLLTVATAHVAETPYWRRTHAAPFADFGSMLGNDAGMNVFHIFQPDLMQIVKSREPKFVSRFQHSQK